MTTKTQERIKASYEATGATVPRDADTGEILTHTEWNGWLFCEAESEPFDWETGEVTCPHCGETFTVPEPRPVDR